ncbi:MAG: bifunctional UDP-N-acetylmuramoyl-tripeptide:D-alanyl-D-alanine ligase/alanine racemase [Saprospiraceae bacterium]|nr:bifunctional UDP-N-acetylmuramoyl-tripeptide:D-alanyl-D-alanine ligase/alanine racemase [Saprospiraceae bacterium]
MNATIESSWISAGRWFPQPPASTSFNEVSIDSRRIFQPTSSLFFCLRGPRHDGHGYIQDAYFSGIRSFVVDHLPETVFPDCHYLIVPDTLAALQELAGAQRRQLMVPIVGITGSNGKTTVKEWLYALLKDDMTITRSPRSYNSQVGVALSLVLAHQEHELVIIEAGISLPGEMARLEKMIGPDIGILTNLGSAHDEGFEDRAGKLREKLALFNHSKKVLIPQSLLHDFPDAFTAIKGKLVTWSETRPADFQVIRVVDLINQQQITYQYKGACHTYSIPFTDEAARQNSIICLLLALELGISPEVLHERMAHLPAISMRLETREGWNNNLIINDYYNADLEALRIALAFFNQRRGNRGGWIILSDLDETGLDPPALNTRIVQLLEPITYERLTLIGENISGLALLLPDGIKVDIHRSTEDFLRITVLESAHHTAILLKGARRFGFEQISRRLVRLVHRTRLEVDLGAMSHNLRYYSGFLKPATRILVMVKASAYGGGSTEVARWLAFQRVHYLGVAYVDEGVELRKAGIKLPILVMNPDEAAFPLILEYGLEPEIHGHYQFQQFLNFLSTTEAVVSVHIKLETGMNRLGFAYEELPTLISQLKESTQIRVASVMSHLTGSDNPIHDQFTAQQADRFTALADMIEIGLGYKPLRHLLNSAGIRRFKHYQYDMVRLGIGLYGLDYEKNLPSPLLPAIALKSRITRIRNVPAGESVGYSRLSITDHPRKIATIAIGYADGLLRLAGEGRFWVLVRNVEAPTVGSVCMDMAMIDVSHIPDAQSGDDVILFDAQKPIGDLALALQTIPYEVLTNISSRVPRIYFDE